MREDGSVRWELRESVGWVTVDRPKALNALSAKVLEELSRALDELHRQSVRCLVFRGAGERAFVAGADIAEMEKMTPVEARAFARLGQRLFQRVEEYPAPVIAAVRGYALGGGLELALACDLIVASEDVQFGQPEINLGIIPGFGGTQRLIRRVGPGMARYLIFTGARISASEASRIGLVDRVVNVAEFDNAVAALARELACKPQFALQQAKAALRAAWNTDIVTGCDREADAFGLTFAHPDRSEGMRAFREKRAAKFG
ncbi:MAG: enoyl-CoA hydratase-related protein [Candidatus Binatia bacterium]|nr:enoyl-CoA hydratase-related protein [Candidatus Binatia bacterium]